MFATTIQLKAPAASVAHFQRLTEAYAEGLKREGQGRVDFKIEGRVVGVERRLLSTRLTWVVELSSSSSRLGEAMERDLLTFAAQL